MAVDEALLMSTANDGYSGALRLYQNKKYCVSLGYFQSTDHLNTGYLHDNNYGYVRRITGGRAVLHGDDLTFSFTGGKDSPFFDTSITKITDKFAIIIADLLKRINIVADISKKSTLSRGDRQWWNSKVNFHCFDSVSKNEILVGGKKIVGYALKKSPDSFLLQGSLLLDIDEDILSNVIKNGNPAAISGRFTCVNDCIADKISDKRLKRAFEESLKGCGFAVEEAGLSQAEAELVYRLATAKYMNPVWNVAPKQYEYKAKQKFAAAK